MKRLITLILVIIMNIPAYSAPGTIATYVIDPVKNAYEHNNLGLMYMEEKAYYAAIQEFKIAISLNPKTQATAVYFNNLGRVYMLIGYPELALDCFKNSITQYSLNFEYYENLAQCYKALGQQDAKLEEYKSKTSPLDRVMTGILYAKSGNKKKAITVLDEFTTDEPNLIITPAVKNYIKKLVDDVNKED